MKLGLLCRAERSARDPPEFVPPELDAVIARHVLKSPIVVHFERTRSRAIHAMVRRTANVTISAHGALQRSVSPQQGSKIVAPCSCASRPDCLEYVGVGLHKQIPDAHRDMLVSISPHVLQAFRLAAYHLGADRNGGDEKRPELRRARPYCDRSERNNHDGNRRRDTERLRSFSRSEPERFA